jgi:hypothetical protein
MLVTLVLSVLGTIGETIGLGSDPLWFIPYSEVIYSIKDSILISLLLAASMPLCYVCVDAITTKQVSKVDQKRPAVADEAKED